MEEKKRSPIVIAAAALSAAAAILVIVAAAVVFGGNGRNAASEPPEKPESVSQSTAAPATEHPAPTATAPQTEPPATTTTVPATTSATTDPEPETTAATVTEAATAATTATTTAPAATTSATTTVTTTAATTAAATATKAVELGLLGYDMAEPLSTDPSLAKGDLSKLVINEICAKNKASLKDSDGDFPDWVEIYNPTDETVNLKGAGLSDSAGDPLKWVFPSVNVQPGGYLIVFCSDKDSQTPELHTGFKISSGNEEIILSKPDGSLIDSVLLPALDDDETLSRWPNGSKELRITSATPGKSNDAAASSREPGLASPLFSKESGFYSEKFSLTITADPGTVIYYTTDGSVPTTSSKKYSSPISIYDRSNERAVYTYKRGTTVDSGSEQFPNQEFEKAMIIRAVAVDSSGKKSPVTTAAYFIGAAVERKFGDVPIVSVVVDPNDLYNEKTGIYVAGDVFTEWRKSNRNAALDGSTPANFNQRGREWERDAHVDYFDGGELGFSIDCGVRCHGGWSRNSQQKSLKFYMRSDYGESRLKYELFENNRAYDDSKVIDEYKRFMIRNGGNDSFIMLFKDAWTQECVKRFPFSTQDCKLAIGFLNGEYWGVYTMMELYDDNYIESNFGVNADNAIMIKAGSLEEGLDSDFNEYWTKEVDFVRNNDMSVEANYQKACEYFDMDSFAEYIAMNAYIGNEDWLWGNWACWRARDTSDKKYEDGKWRFMVYDTEYSMNLYGSGNDYKYDILTSLVGGDGHLGPMLKSLLKNKDFKSRLVLAFEDSMNIAFNPTSASRLLDSFYSDYSPYLSQHFRRFIFWQSENGVSQNVSSWKNWLKRRYDYMPEQISKALGLGSSSTKTLTISTSDSAGGWVYINGIPITLTNKKWEGKYFPGYKIEIKAVPANGYEFSGWSGGYDGSSAVITVDPSSALSLQANFTKK